jgi:hypothetical protein
MGQDLTAPCLGVDARSGPPLDEDLMTSSATMAMAYPVRITRVASTVGTHLTS